MDIYDEEKQKWYEIVRGWRGRLTLQEIVYTSIRRAPTKGDLVFPRKGLLQILRYAEPPTPQPR